MPHVNTHTPNFTFSHHIYPHHTTLTHTPPLDIPITPEHTDTALQSRHVTHIETHSTHITLIPYILCTDTHTEF